MRLIVILWYARRITVIFYLFSCYSSSLNYSTFYLNYKKEPIHGEDYRKYWNETFYHIDNFFYKIRSKTQWLLIFCIFYISKFLLKIVLLYKEKTTLLTDKIINNNLYYINNAKPEFYEPIKKKLDQFHLWKEGFITWDEIDWQKYYWETLLPRVDDFDEHYQFRLDSDWFYNFTPPRINYTNFIDIYSSIVSTPSCLFLILFLLPAFLYTIYFICNFFSFRKHK